MNKAGAANVEYARRAYITQLTKLSTGIDYDQFGCTEKPHPSKCLIQTEPATNKDRSNLLQIIFPPITVTSIYGCYSGVLFSGECSVGYRVPR